MGQRCGARDVIDCHELDVAIAKTGAQDIAPDTPEPIDANLDAHTVLLALGIARKKTHP